MNIIRPSKCDIVILFCLDPSPVLYQIIVHILIASLKVVELNITISSQVAGVSTLAALDLVSFLSLESNSIFLKLVSLLIRHLEKIEDFFRPEELIFSHLVAEAFDVFNKGDGVGWSVHLLI